MKRISYNMKWNEMILIIAQLFKGSALLIQYFISFLISDECGWNHKHNESIQSIPYGAFMESLGIIKS